MDQARNFSASETEEFLGERVPLKRLTTGLSAATCACDTFTQAQHKVNFHMHTIEGKILIEPLHSSRLLSYTCIVIYNICIYFIIIIFSTAIIYYYIVLVRIG